MPTPEPAEIVRLDEMTDLAAAIPHLLGFHPTDSVVAVALRRSRVREQMSFTMRLDLLPDETDEQVAREIAMRMSVAGAVAVLLVLFTPRGVGGVLPREGLVEAVQRTLEVPLRDALLVDGGRVWSYVCGEPRCCPAEGRELRLNSRGATALAAAHALRGDVVLPDRDALVATTRAVGGIAAVSMDQAQGRAVSRLLAAPEEMSLEASRALVETLRARYADPPVELSHDEAAEVVVRLHDVRFRDELLSRVARDDDLLVALLRDVARLAQPPDDAPVAAVLAMTGYLRGDGVVAVAAAERALATDRDYSLARLVLDAVSGQLEPAKVRGIWAQAGRDGDPA